MSTRRASRTSAARNSSFRNVDNVRLHNIQIFDQLGPAVSVTNARRLSLDHVSSPILPTGQELVSLEQVT